jgi:phosphatidylserine decarboxylase
MIRFHKEGNFILLVTILLCGTIGILSWLFLPTFIAWFGVLVAVVFFGLVAQFFRNPIRIVPNKDNTLVYAPADGKIVVIEEVEEPEYFKDRRLQVSVFMSPFNVHVNRNAIGGKVNYYRYHEGKYLVAWHPKASTENERTSVVLDNGKTEVLFRQIAGSLAKRITNYLTEGQKIEQGTEMGFIKFGSRVDIFLPLDAKIQVKIDEVVKGNLTVIAKI